MRALIAFDKFKDALSAEAACEVAARVLRHTHPDWELDLCPLTDGGESFGEILTKAAHGRLDCHAVTGPMGATVRAPIGFVDAAKLPPPVRSRLALAPAERIAVIGMASASGLELVPPDRRNPWRTTTRGTGELIGHARDAGASVIVLGVGGSATNDLGLGALAALGWLFDREPLPENWPHLRRIGGGACLPRIIIACDVVNPLLGAHGATATFGPQKGLKPADVPCLDAEMARVAALLCAAAGQPFTATETPGAGAAGGIACGLMVAAGATLTPGFELVSDWLGLADRIAAADLVITGEGRFDATSLAGKGPGSLVREARRQGKTAHVFAGSLGITADGFHHAITPAGLPLPEALARCPELLAEAVARTCGLCDSRLAAAERTP
ncbi:glycerate kinase [Oleiharenicola lentus]|uniref:Glycerate kinase n=1 Tax=Oleiharenicola lentus TaxID=2508720 RepID=A0A4Q1C4B6_9BACT|nr:glycerate kinase [Oleiharenicola lentus]RXK53123.1 glycerate kinase [Oleiharenicola lentus]